MRWKFFSLLFLRKDASKCLILISYQNVKSMMRYVQFAARIWLERRFPWTFSPGNKQNNSKTTTWRYGFVIQSHRFPWHPDLLPFLPSLPAPAFLSGSLQLPHCKSNQETEVAKKNKTQYILFWLSVGFSSQCAYVCHHASVTEGVHKRINGALSCNHYRTLY